MDSTLKTILIVILILLLLGFFPAWGPIGIGYGVYGGGSLLIIVLVVLLVTKL